MYLTTYYDGTNLKKQQSDYYLHRFKQLRLNGAKFCSFCRFLPQGKLFETAIEEMHMTGCINCSHT